MPLSVPAGVLAAVLFLAGCAQPVVPIERLGRKAAEGVRPHVRPLAAPPSRLPPPPVVDRVPTRDRVVFLTYDATDHPAALGELRLPVSRFPPGSALWRARRTPPSAPRSAPAAPASCARPGARTTRRPCARPPAAA